MVEDSGATDAGNEPDDVAVHNLSRCQRDCFVVGWCSFLVAAVGTMFLFAWVDPMLLSQVTEPPLDVDRMTGYAIGFFFLWILSAASAFLTVYLIRTRHGHPPPGD